MYTRVSAERVRMRVSQRMRTTPLLHTRLAYRV